MKATAFTRSWRSWRLGGSIRCPCRVKGALETVDLAADLARKAHMRVITVDYRLAPEDPHPAASLDAMSAYRALLDGGHDVARIATADRDVAVQDADAGHCPARFVLAVGFGAGIAILGAKSRHGAQGRGDKARSDKDW